MLLAHVVLPIQYKNSNRNHIYLNIMAITFRTPSHLTMFGFPFSNHSFVATVCILFCTLRLVLYWARSLNTWDPCDLPMHIVGTGYPLPYIDDMSIEILQEAMHSIRFRSEVSTYIYGDYQSGVRKQFMQRTVEVWEPITSSFTRSQCLGCEMTID